MMNYIKNISIIALILLLMGCGTSIPTVSELGDKDYPGLDSDDPLKRIPAVSATSQIEFEIKSKVYCELKDAVREAAYYRQVEADSLSGPKKIKYNSLIPPDWIAQISLSLQIDESISLTPGLTFTELMPNAVKRFGVQTITSPQTFTFVIGTTASSTATRIDKFNPQYSIEFLSKEQTKDSICDPENDPFLRLEPSWTTPKSSPFLVESNLGIKDWLIGAMVVNSLIPSDLTEARASNKKQRVGVQAGRPAAVGGDGGGGGQGVKADTVSYEIKFAIVTSGNATPTWKLIPVTGPSASLPLFSTGRTRTHDLIITIGPNSTITTNSNLASQINSRLPSPIN